MGFRLIRLQLGRDEALVHLVQLKHIGQRHTLCILLFVCVCSYMIPFGPRGDRIYSKHHYHLGNARKK